MVHALISPLCRLALHYYFTISLDSRLIYHVPHSHRVGPAVLDVNKVLCIPKLIDKRCE